MNEETTRRLRQAAEAHQPDRARILARMERGAAGPAAARRARPKARSWPRAVLAALVTAGILTTGGLAVAGIVGSPAPSAAPTKAAVPPPTATRSAPSSPSPDSTTARPGPPTATTAPGAPHPTASAGSRSQSGPLWAQGSVDPHSTVYWGQSNLVLKTAQQLTSLTLELRIAETGGVQYTGTWRTLPSDDFTVSHQQIGGALVYRWVLKPGRTVPAGQYEFAAQYNHATGPRDVTGDGFRVDARGPSGPNAVWGGFAPTP
ncbi:hypothetical protein ACEZCY_37380 [Streptacidiphilus sp. N1-12]|uniref:Uncharacterized protein n=2 Tax=Streptacidiphilus alkalitolerans TaxID=3342712 RepID=A0ABV6VM14_9ACTN